MVGEDDPDELKGFSGGFAWWVAVKIGAWGWWVKGVVELQRLVFVTHFSEEESAEMEKGGSFSCMKTKECEIKRERDGSR